MFGHPRGLDRRDSTWRSRKYKSAPNSCNWRTSPIFREDKRVPQKSAVQNTTQRCIAYRTRARPAENSYGLAELTVRPPLIPRAVDGQGGAGMLDIDEEHLAVGREGRAGEFGIVHAVMPEAVDLACGRYAD